MPGPSKLDDEALDDEALDDEALDDEALDDEALDDGDAADESSRAASFDAGLPDDVFAPDPSSPDASSEDAPPELLDIEVPVPVGRGGYRVDRFLSLRFTRLSRNRIHKMIALGRVVDARTGEPFARNAQRVREGQVVRVQRPKPKEPPVTRHFSVVHEDETLLVVDKPAGLPVHPSARYLDHTLTALMTERYGAGHGWEMAHRLDRETSGLMLFGRAGTTATVLKRAFFRRKVEKQYLAIVHGTIDAPVTIDIPLGPAGSRIKIKMGPVAVERGGLAALTNVEPLAWGTFRGAPITLVSARPKTGRQHQIRAHLALVGHGLLGDKMYGVDERLFLDVVERGRPMHDLEEELGLARHALHAHALHLTHPSEGVGVSFRAAWPADLAEVLALPPVRDLPSVRNVDADDDAE